MTHTLTERTHPDNGATVIQCSCGTLRSAEYMLSTRTYDNEGNREVMRRHLQEHDESAAHPEG